jgi:hypothetical protein
VFAALAASRWIEAQTGWSIKKFIRTARRHRTIEIQAGPRLINAADPLPDDLREALTKINAGNPGIGRPANVEIIFNRHIRRDTPGVFRTAFDRPKIGPDTGGVVLNLFYKHSRVKQYLKDGKAMRIETVINSPRDLLAPPGVHPVPQGPIVDPQVPGHLSDRLTGLNHHLHGLSLELRAELAAMLRHGQILSVEPRVTVQDL